MNKISDQDLRLMMQTAIREAMNPPLFAEWKKEYLHRARVEVMNIAMDHNLSLSNEQIENLAQRVITLYADEALDMHWFEAIDAVINPLLPQY